jgi:putative ubiquitin-RnfH superfamily antitoxin RatB of RatAB toxin-antitoxin module
MVMNKINIEITYAAPSQQYCCALSVSPETTIREAIDLSGILKRFPEIDLTRNKVGIFSQVCQLTDLVKEGDRVEIYRPLLIDPKEARREKAKR